MQRVEIVPPYYGNKHDKYIIDVPDNETNIRAYLTVKRIQFHSWKHIDIAKERAEQRDLYTGNGFSMKQA